jgi:predicted extracellular nuclease
MPTTSPALFLLFLATLPACIESKPLDTTDTDDTTGGADGPSVFDVNDGTVPLESIVTLEGLVVTSPLNRDGDGFFVADPAGGANSGLYVWRQTGFADLAIAVGDEVRVTGTTTEFFGWIELVVDSFDDISVTGEATVPAPVALGDGAGVDWEQYESVAVQLDAQTVTSVDAFNTGTLSAGIKLDDGFQYLDFDCRGQFATLSGIVFYQYEAHSLNPRSETDLGVYSAPVAEPATVAQVQSGAMCGPVIFEDVVATTGVAEDDGSALFFVQDAGGGANSGAGVFVKDVLVDVNPGDIVTLTGSADEFFDFTQMYVADATGFEASGETGTPVAESLSEMPADWEPYEGMLVTLADVVVTSDQTYGEVSTDWSIKMDDLYFDHTAANGDRYATVTGVVYYSYSEWKIEPRSEADLVE